jgi:putative membrane protein
MSTPVPAEPPGDRPERRRFPRSVYDRGSEPDPRFSLANERTFLAWIRTSLAFAASGVALKAVTLSIPGAVQTAAALLLVVISLAAGARAWFGWMRVERALREDRVLPGPSIGVALTAGLVLAVALVALGWLL